jgi:phosphoribosyl-AMP cyclohydrolase
MTSALQLDFDKCDGLIPAIVRHAVQGDVLMLGYVNRTAWEQTLATGWVTFYSRSRQRLWLKGETSGNRLRFVRAFTDCDADALLIEAEFEGQPAVCHEGFRGCFFRAWSEGGFREQGERVFDPAEVYGR